MFFMDFEDDIMYTWIEKRSNRSLFKNIERIGCL